MTNTRQFSVPHAGTDGLCMTWDQFRLWLLCYGFRAEHDLKWARRMYQKWGCLMPYTADMSDVESEYSFENEFIDQVDALTDCGTKRHPAVVDEDEVDDVMDWATEALDKLSENPDLAADDLLNEIAARQAQLEDEKYSALPSNRVDLEKRRNELLREMSAHACRPCEDGVKCGYRLRMDKDFKRVQKAIRAMPTRAGDGPCVPGLYLELRS